MQKERDNLNKQEITLLRSDGRQCYCCGKTGHMSITCCHKDGPNAEWGINKTQQSFTQPQAKPSSTYVGTAQQSSNEQQISENNRVSADFLKWTLCPHGSCLIINHMLPYFVTQIWSKISVKPMIAWIYEQMLRSYGLRNKIF
jgi:hypothetical protein